MSNLCCWLGEDWENIYSFFFEFSGCFSRLFFEIEFLVFPKKIVDCSSSFFNDSNFSSISCSQIN